MKSFLVAAPRLNLLLFVGILFLALLSACGGPKAKDKLDDRTWHFVNQDSLNYVFPDSAKGNVTVLGFIYTNCPDICPMMVSNMRAVDKILTEQGVHANFVFATFDPSRDTPQKMMGYFKAFKLDPQYWDFLSSTQDEVDDLTKRLKFKVYVQEKQYTPSGHEYYFIDHSDKVAILNDNGQVMEYFNGSKINPEVIAEYILDLEK